MKCAGGDIDAQVHWMRHEAEGVISLGFRGYGTALPPFTPGAHIDLHLPNGLVRSYSLMNRPDERGAYRIGVYREPSGRGGSKYVHEQLRPGQLVRLSAPRNNFPLCADAAQSVFIAGGIGITPFAAMIAKLNQRGLSWTLYYCVRTQARVAFLDELNALAVDGKGSLVLNLDGEPQGKILDIAAVIGSAPPDAHFYCCGPAGMIAAFREACAGIDASRVHFEYFSAGAAASTAGGFDVVLAKAGKRIRVAPGNTILETVLAAGIAVPYSCQQGICGTCEVKVLSGRPDHRDMILSDEAKSAGGSMLICCSSSLTEELVLDL